LRTRAGQFTFADGSDADDKVRRAGECETGGHDEGQVEAAGLIDDLAG